MTTITPLCSHSFLVRGFEDEQESPQWNPLPTKEDISFQQQIAKIKRSAAYRNYSWQVGRFERDSSQPDHLYTPRLRGLYVQKRIEEWRTSIELFWGPPPGTRSYLCALKNSKSNGNAASPPLLDNAPASLQQNPLSTRSDSTDSLFDAINDIQQTYRQA